jgi:hypothetical protein
MMPHAYMIFTIPYISIKYFRGNSLHLTTTSGRVCFTQKSAIEINDKMFALAKFTGTQLFSLSIITYLNPTLIFNELSAM